MPCFAFRRWPPPRAALLIADRLVLPLGSRLFRSLKYRPRVLDAWVEEHQGRIEQCFSAIATVEQRRHHLSLPVKVGHKLEPELTPERLRELDGLDGLVLISGEGGVGKTCMALRIAGWALEGRLTDRAVVPVLVEADLQEGEALRIRAEVVTPELWKLPLPAGEQLEMVLVPGGEAQIGSPQTEEGRDWYANQRDGCKGVNVEAERTLRLEPFAIARHAITQAQWRAVAELPQVEKALNPTPGSHKPDGLWETHAQPGALPVDSISWNDCQEWLQRLNRWLTSEWSSRGGKGEPPQLALPGEGQWETACQIGASTPFHFGDTLDASWATFNGGYSYGPGRKGVYRQRPVPVGFFGLVNRRGLVELHGQLFEWCGDQWHPDPTGEGWPRDGQAWQAVDPALEALGTAQKDWKLLRGGSWFNEPHNCRAADRNSNNPANINTNNGVRPCW